MVAPSMIHRLAAGRESLLSSRFRRDSDVKLLHLVVQGKMCTIYSLFVIFIFLSK